ncbi:uncharacterized protein LOC117640602 [Thrips palmi]|uniref:Uncharacterized protein LOC117640602 n=1 Tax=Thrips palmi TaxID=161013 RepID=A0A6P8YGL1_THRPL|nr:uncharacterized protein LOC117640602 [Thrips palmi]
MSIRGDAGAGAPERSAADSEEPTDPPLSETPPTEASTAEATPATPSPGDEADADDSGGSTTTTPVRADYAVGRRGPRGRRRSRGRSLDAPPSPKTRKRKTSTIPDGEWLPGTWPAGHGGGSVTSVGVGVGVMETEQLISEIERRPGIYDSGCPQYQDRVAKWTLWCEVCEIMTPRWHHLDEDRKAARVKELQKRWKSLRDSFMKELKLQREIQRTGQIANRKKYVFFDQMTFLMPCLEARGSTRSVGGLVLREVDPYESETDSSKAERDGGDAADANECQSDDAPVNLSTANGSGVPSLSGLGSLSGLAGLGGLSALASLGTHSVLGSVATTATTSGSGGAGSQSDEEASKPAHLLTTATTTTTSANSVCAAYETGRTKYRPAASSVGQPEWKRRRSGTPLAPLGVGMSYDDDEDDPDGDRLFMLSLVPSLRNLRGAAKSALKIELAQLVHKTLYEPDDALADSMTESLAPVVSLAEGSPASSTQSECGACGTSKCTCRTKMSSATSNNHPVPLALPLPLPLTLPLPLSRGMHSPKRARLGIGGLGLDFSNFNGHSKVHGV